MDVDEKWRTEYYVILLFAGEIYSETHWERRGRRIDFAQGNLQFQD